MYISWLCITRNFHLLQPNNNQLIHRTKYIAYGRILCGACVGCFNEHARTFELC
jgi:hypothetical protein